MTKHSHRELEGSIVPAAALIRLLVVALTLIQPALAIAADEPESDSSGYSKVPEASRWRTMLHLPVI